MKKRNFALLTTLCALSLNAAANTSLIVKPVGDYQGGIELGGGYKRITIDSDMNNSDLINSLVSSGKFTSVEIDTEVSRPNKQVQHYSSNKANIKAQSVNTIDDPYFELQNYLHSPESHINGSNLQNAVEYLNEIKGDEGEKVRVLVVDGSFYENPEIPFAEGYSFTNLRDDGLESRPNFYASEPAGECTNEHGTAVSSIYSALRDNGKSIAGAVPNLRIIAAEALVCNSGYMSDVIKSMYWGMGEAVGDATNISDPVNVINLSLGLASDTCSPAFQQAINLANQRGIQVHVSAGNSSTDASANSPSNCEKVFVTGSLNSDADTVAEFSNRGSDVNVYAQGVGILGLDSVEGSVSTWNGTSFSVALTGSTGTILKSNYPEITPEQAFWFMERSSRTLSDQPTCQTTPCEKGQLDALAASKRAESYFSQATTTIKPALAAGESCLSGYVGKYFTEKSGLCGLYEVSFEPQTNKSNIVYQLHGTRISDGQSSIVAETPESSIVIRDIDLQENNYHYSICTNGECVVSPLVFSVDRTTPQECQQ